MHRRNEPGDEVVIFGVGGEGFRWVWGFGLQDGCAPEEVQVLGNLLLGGVPPKLRAEQDLFQLPEQRLRGDQIEVALEPSDK